MSARGSGRVVTAALALAAAIVLGACGGTTGPSGGIGSGAERVPASTLAYASLRTDQSSAQWQALTALLGRFPSGPEAVTWLADLEPALGSEVDLALLSAVEGGRPEAVVLTEPAHPEALEQRLAQAGDRIAWRAEDGWYAMSPSREALDRVLEASSGEALAQDARYRAAVDGLPVDAAATLYVSGAALVDAGGPILDAIGTANAGQEPGAAGLAAVAEPGGLRLVGTADPGDVPPPAAAEAVLPAAAPADALVYLSAADLRPALERLTGGGGSAGLLGAMLEEMLAPLADGEHALVVRDGGEKPEVTLLAAPADPAAAEAALDELIASVGQLAPLAGSDLPALQSSDVTIDGVEATRIEIGDRAELFAARVGDRIVVTNAERAIAALVDPPPSLAESTRFLTAAATAGMPGRTVGFAWIDLAGLVSHAAAHHSHGAGGRDVAAELAPLDTLSLYATPGSGGSLSLAGHHAVE
jgi:hypothetical protein